MPVCKRLIFSFKYSNRKITSKKSKSEFFIDIDISYFGIQNRQLLDERAK